MSLAPKFAKLGRHKTQMVAVAILFIMANEYLISRFCQEWFRYKYRDVISNIIKNLVVKTQIKTKFEYSGSFDTFYFERILASKKETKTFSLQCSALANDYKQLCNTNNKRTNYFAFKDLLVKIVDREIKNENFN